jgi:hypothetical protein
MLEKIDALTELRIAIDIAVRQHESGEGEELDMEAIIKEAHRQHAHG